MPGNDNAVEVCDDWERTGCHEWGDALRWKAEPQMDASRAGEELKNDVPDIIRNCGKGKPKQVWPHSYQAYSLGGIDLIWFADEEQNLIVAIQAKYFDFVFGRFPRATFWATEDSMIPIQARVRSKGKNGVVALIAQFDVAGELEKPKERKEWRNEMHPEDLPVVAEEDRSAVREGEGE